MAVKEIIKIPDPVLREMCGEIADVTPELNVLMDDMLETMYDAPGIGLAAPQINIPIRLIVMDAAKREEEEKPNPIIMVNPVIISASDERSLYEEGCLSIPDYYAEVERPAAVNVAYIDRHGKMQEMVCEDLLATVVQHEIDHLNGKLFIDYLSKLRRDRVIKKFAKAKKTDAL
ncbi:MAG: peptide deformylase [Rhodomicrobium sp.]|nr:MAG: peptide deformylase [Rhodomicrobium sp.]